MTTLAKYALTAWIQVYGERRKNVSADSQDSRIGSDTGTEARFAQARVSRAVSIVCRKRTGLSYEAADCVSVCHRNPNGKREVLVHPEKYGSCKSVVSVQDGKVAPVEESNQGLRHGVVFPNKGCSCPEPLLSVFQICRWCVLTKSAVTYDPVNAVHRSWRKYRSVQR
jgi:hypothetical protein